MSCLLSVGEVLPVSRGIHLWQAIDLQSRLAIAAKSRTSLMEGNLDEIINDSEYCARNFHFCGYACRLLERAEIT